MRRILTLGLLAFTALGQPRNSTQFVMPDKPWELLGQGYQLTAASAVDSNGVVYFTDHQNQRILRVDLDGIISTWKQPSNGTHGVAFGPEGRLYGGQHDNKRIVAFSPDGQESVIAEGMQTHHLTVTSRGEVYFAEAPLHRVSMVDAAGHTRVVTEALDFPRGICLSKDGKALVVNDPHTVWVWKFDVRPDGALANGQRFCRLQTGDATAASEAEDMAFDSEGFLYVSTKIGVQVFDRRGRAAAVIETPGTEGASAVFFAGPALQWLYVTDGSRLYRRLSKRRGAGM